MPTERERRSGGRARDVLTRDSFAKHAGLGCSFAATILVFGAVGWWLDGLLSTTPLFLVVGMLAGFAGGLYSMVKRVSPASGRKPPGSPPTSPS